MSQRTVSRGRNRRQGFTLMEILLVAAILVIIASMATLGFTAMQRRATRNLAQSEINTIETGCTMFKTAHMRYPTRLEELATPPQGMNRTEWGGPYVQVADFNDPWSRPYKYSADEINDRVIITSSGPDMREGTEDDITNQRNM